MKCLYYILYHVIAVDPAQADAAIAAIEAAGEKAYRVGSIEAGEKGVILK